MTTLRAAVSRRIITPPPGIYLMGYGNRIQGNTGVHDDLAVTTLVLQTDDSRTALLTVDHAFINAVVVDEVKRRIGAQGGIAPHAIFVCCSHTHAGPIGYADEDSPPEDREYMTFLVNQLVQSVIEASGQLEPVRLLAGATEAYINVNRRERAPDGTIVIGNNPAGPVDPSVQVLQAISRQDKPVATLVNYACHPVVMGPQNRQVTADWVGVMRRDVEAQIGGLCLFFQGAAGDINPRKMSWTADNWGEIVEQGAAVAKAVGTACDAATPLAHGPIQAKQAVSHLRLMAPRGYNDELRAFMPAGVSTDEEIRSAIRERFPWHVEIERRRDGLYSPVFIGTVRIGDWMLATLATEPFCETGLAVKAASPAGMTFVAGYANGCNSYLPTREAYEDGGYEVETAALFYGLPAGFAPGGAERVTEALVRIMR